MRVDILLCTLFSILVLQMQQISTQSNFDDFKHETGKCDTLRVELWASLIMRKANEIFQVTQMIPRSIRMDLYTRRNPYKRQVLPLNDLIALEQSNFNANLPVRIIIHGWSSHALTCSCAALKDAYIRRGDFNILLLDWSEYAMNVNYAHVVLELPEVAAHLNTFTSYLHSATGVPYEQMYLIGHSAGSHIAGLAGKRLPPPIKYGVIYALDPAGPIHVWLHQSLRLTPTDAHYVEAIHTDVAFFGYDEPTVANASFFVNWGLGQPHCPNVTTNEPAILCDHFGAVYYFAESVQRPQSFGAIQCDDFESLYMQVCQCANKLYKCNAHVFMGGEPATPKTGVFYLSTRARRPFGYGPIVRMQTALPSTVIKL